MPVRGFNDDLLKRCADRCAEFGDPPCWKLPDLIEPFDEVVTPCDECLGNPNHRDTEHDPTPAPRAFAGSSSFRQP